MGEERINGYRLIKGECSYGSMENYINLKTDHGVIWDLYDYTQAQDDNLLESKRPLLNACDSTRDSIRHFGRCSSPKNINLFLDPELLIATLICPLSFVFKIATGCIGPKCEPLITDCWFNPDKTHLVGGAPIITTDSRLYCRNGGVIKLLKPETETEEGTHGGGGGKF